MTIESATYIGQLNASYPTGTDPKSEGDGQIRLVKSVLVNQLASLGNVALTATAAQLNALASSSGLLSVGTSTSSVAIGTGSKSFTTQTGLGFAAGQAVRIQDNASTANYMTGQITSYTSSTGALVVSVTTTGGSGTIADWSISIIVQSPLVRRAVTGADTVVASDWAGLIDVTSGTFSLAVTAAASLPGGFWAIVRNSGTGVVTIDPNSSETIGGASTFILYPSQAILIYVSGSNLDYLMMPQNARATISTGAASGTSVALTPSALRNASYIIVVGNVTTTGTSALQLNSSNIHGGGGGATFRGLVHVEFDASGNALCASSIAGDSLNAFATYMSISTPSTLTLSISGGGSFTGGTITFIRTR